MRQVLNALLLALLILSSLAMSDAERTPEVSWRVEYDPILPLTSPFTLRVTLQGEDVDISRTRVYIIINVTEMEEGLGGKEEYRTELLRSNETFTLLIPPPMRRFNFTFHLELHGDGVPGRYPTLDELPVSFVGEVVDGDGDGMDDRWEVENGLDPGRGDDFGGDEDGDGLTNLEEYNTLTSPVRRDSDGDGMPDGWEEEMGTCQFLPDGDVDYDGDGATNLQEFHLKTDPRDPTSVPDLSPPTPWYYIMVIVGVLLALIGYFAAQMFINRREEEFLKDYDR